MACCGVGGARGGGDGGGVDEGDRSNIEFLGDVLHQQGLLLQP